MKCTEREKQKMITTSIIHLLYIPSIEGLLYS